MSVNLVSVLPDVPRYVELRSAILDDEAVVLGDEHDAVVIADDAAIFLVGRPPRALVEAALVRAPGADVIFEPEHRAHAESMAVRRAERIVVHRRDRHPIPSAHPARMITSVDPGILPDELRAELVGASERVPIAMAFAGERPVAFAYAGAITETLWDISIDTALGYRRAGYATSAVACLVEHMAEKEPVWCAMEENPASMGLAAKLGFLPVDALYLLPADAFIAARGT